MPQAAHVVRFFFFNDTATTEIYTLSLHDALPISPDPGTHPGRGARGVRPLRAGRGVHVLGGRSEEHTSELQSRLHLVCRLLLEKKKKAPRAWACSATVRSPHALPRLTRSRRCSRQ